MESRAPDAGAEPVLRDEPGEQQREGCALDDHDKEHQPAQQHANVADCDVSELDAEELTLAQPEAPAEDQQQRARVHRHAEPAGVDQQRDHHLAEAAPVIGGVDAHQASHAHR